MQQSSPFDALIVGAGPVGLTMAANLHHHGLRCRIIDKAPQPSDKSKALAVWSRTLELLDKLGLAETFVRQGLKAKGASIYSRDKRVVHVQIAGVDSPFNYPLMIPQSETERLLTEHLSRQGVTIERQVELSTFSQQGNSVTGALLHADGTKETFETPWLVGCDGAHSTVRHTLGIPFTGEAEQNDWILADVHIAGPIAPDEVSVFWHEKGVLAMFPITPNRFRIIADIGTAKHTKAPPDPTLAEVQAKVDERGPAGLVISDPVWLAGFRINERKVSEYRQGRVFLAGDAAHIHSPAGGQGMNTGMQDTFNLAWKLALVHRGAAPDGKLLDSYSLERSAVGDQVLRGAGMMTLMATLRNPVAQFLRNHTAAVLTSFGFVQDKIKNNLCELAINYRHGPLSAQDWPRHAGELAAGDRMPDAPLQNASDNTTSTLFGTMHATRFTLLLLPGSENTSSITSLQQLADEIERVFPETIASHFILKAGSKLAKDPPSSPGSIDVEDRIRHRLGIKEHSVALIRPDGYIGYLGQPADVGALRNYLEQILTRK